MTWDPEEESISRKECSRPSSGTEMPKEVGVAAGSSLMISTRV